MHKSKSLSEGEFFADKFMDLANLAAVILVFGQLVSNQINLYGLVLGILFYVFAITISKKLRGR